MEKECRCILKKSNNLLQLCDFLNLVKDKKLRGTYFEYFAQYILKYDSRYSNFVKNCWTLKELPTKIRNHLDIPQNDIGIDLIVETIDSDYYAVQVKYRRNTNIEINWDELSTFFGLTFGLTHKFKKGILFTNTRNPNKYIKGHTNVIRILYHTLCDITENTFIKIHNALGDNKEIITYNPRQYQVDIVNDAIKYYENNDIGKLFMACGTGKTIVSYWITEKLEHNRVCIAVPSLYLLSQTYSKWCEIMKENYLLVGSDVEVKTCDDSGLLISTNKKDIKKYLKKHDKCVIITTYQSSDIVADVCRELEYVLDLIIFDEAHKTVGNSERQFSYLLNNKNIQTKKKLFMTATERIYKGCDDSDDYISMDNEKIYGKTIYEYNFKKAIEEDQLCDYTPLHI